jgi:hypothetical protein
MIGTTSNVMLLTFEMGIPPSESQFVAIDHAATILLHPLHHFCSWERKAAAKKHSRWIRLW